MDRELLEKPFDPKLIKQRKGNFGTTLDYVETATVIQRLNESFDGNWSFEIKEYQQMNGEVVVLGRLTAEGISKMQFGSSKITTNTKTGEVISLGDDLKAASSDCLKKCSVSFGVGLHLYGAEKPEQPEKGNMAEKTQPKGEEKITKEQLAKIKEIRTKLGLTPKYVEEKAKELFNADKVQELNPTMAQALIAFLENNGNRGGDY